MSDHREIELLQQQLIDMQSQLAFQEDTLTGLNAIVTKQQQQIENLNELVNKQKSQLEAMDNGQDGGTQQELPPHY